MDGGSKTEGKMRKGGYQEGIDNLNGRKREGCKMVMGKDKKF